MSLLNLLHVLCVILLFLGHLLVKDLIEISDCLFVLFIELLDLFRMHELQSSNFICRGLS